MSSFSLQNSTVYFRNEFVKFSDANVSIASSSVLYGLSIYSVFGVSWNESDHSLYVFRLRDHYQRLINSAKIMDFHSFVENWSYYKFEKTMIELISVNNIHEDVLVRVTVFIDELVAGTKIHSLKNSLSAYVYPMGEILPRSGVHVCVSSWQRTSDNAIPSRAKINGSYVNASLMKNEAMLNGYDDAIAIDEHGHVSEGTVANLFVVKDNQLITPDTATDILEGITRNTVIVLAEKLGIKVAQRTIDRSELYTVDEAFFCGSSARITPILSIDKRPIANKPGPITQKLIKNLDLTQRNINKDLSDWLIKVN